MSRSIPAGHHLTVDIRLGPADLTLIFQISRTGLFEDLESPAAMTENRLGTADPWIIMAEDSGIFLISRRVRRDLPKFYMIGCISRSLQDNAVSGIQAFFHTSERTGSSGRTSIFRNIRADSGHHTHSLWFDKDLAFFADLASYRIGHGIISTQEPVAVPAGIHNSLFHSSHFF